MRSLVFANFMAPNITSVYAFVAAQVGRALGIETELIEGSAYEQLRDGSVGVAALCGLPYVRLCQERAGSLRLLAAPVIDEPRYQDQPVYFSDVIVRRDSPFRSFADLRGRSWAHNEPKSFSGCLLVRHHLLQMGESEAFFGRVTFSGAHQESIRRVLNGELDASAIDSHVLGVERLRNPDLAGKIRVIAVLGPSSIPPIVATTTVPEEVQAGVSRTLYQLGEDPVSRPALARGLIRRFVPIDDVAYDDIRRMMAAVDKAVPHRHELAGLGA